MEQRKHWFIPHDGARVVMGTLACTLVLLAVRATVQSTLADIHLPKSEPPGIWLLTIGTLACTGSLTSVLMHPHRSILYGALIPSLVYLSWALVQQNFIFNPDLWKLWERQWLHGTLATAITGLVLSILIRFITSRSHLQADTNSAYRNEE